MSIRARWAVSAVGTLLLPVGLAVFYALVSAGRGTESFDELVLLACIALGLVFVWLAPMKCWGRLLISVLYLLATLAGGFVLGAELACARGSCM